MGCGMSTMDAEKSSSSGCLNRNTHHLTISKPVTENSPAQKKDFDNEDVGVIMVMKPLGDNEEAKIAKEVGSKEEEENVVLESQEGNEDHNMHVEKTVNNNEEKHGEDNDWDDRFIGPGSPSFRDYCIDFDTTNRSSMVDSNDYCDSVDSNMNSSDHGSINSNSMQKNEQSVDSTKESEKKDRRGRGFRSIINRGKRRGGRKNLLNFVCYNASSESNAVHEK